MRIQIYISVTVLILIHKSTSEAVSHLSPPANVSIHCDSYGVEVRWEYPDLSQDVRFFVEVTAAVNPDKRILQNITQKLSLNISSMLFCSANNYYSVTVKAMRGGQQSESRVSDIFSFNEDVTYAKIKCNLDFPEVELSPKDGKLHVQFINPLDLYRNTPALRNLSDNLIYTVEAEKGAQKHVYATCELETKTCETSIVFSEHRGNYCVNMTGSIGQRKLNPRKYCFTGDIRIYPSFTVYLYPVLGLLLTLLFLTGIILLVVMKYNSEIKKKASSVRPRFLDIKPTQTHLCKLLKLDPEIVASNLQIEPVEGPKEQTTLLEILCCSDKEPVSGDKGSGDSDTENPYGAKDLDDAEPDDSTDGYDCPHALSLEMSPGDMVKGYGR